MSPAVLEVSELTKQFTGTLALDHVDFTVQSGEIHALLGENGAGKSTLIKVLAGIYSADGGSVRWRGEERRLGAGVLPLAVIHQDLGLVESMTVAENVALVAGYRRSGPVISWSKVRRRARDALSLLGSEIDPDEEIRSLAAAERSIVAIARALAVECELLILDEPTATLPSTEVQRLFTVLTRLRDQGLPMIYVTHRLDEVFQLADHVTVLRDGRRVSSKPVSEVTRAQLVVEIVGREVSSIEPPRPPERGAAGLELRAVSVGEVGPVSLRVARGEIVGLVGLVGAGHHRIGRGLVGDDQISNGEVLLDSVALKLNAPRAAIQTGIGFLSSQRADESLLTTLTVQENLYARSRPHGRIPLIQPRDEQRAAMRAIRQFSIRPPEPNRPITILSGGNQQKVVLARTMLLGRRMLVLEEPTFGVDVGAKADIYALLKSDAEDGKVIVMVSSDFEEVTLVCHRAIVFYRGRVVGEVTRGEMSIERLTTMALGAE